MSKKPEKNLSPRISNRKASHDYHIHEKIEVGVVLRGSEVKSIRGGEVSLGEGYARVEPGDMGLYLYDVDIAAYSHAAGANGHEPKRVRKLLAHRREIVRLLDRTQAKGATLIPLAMYFVRGNVKVELGVATGKGAYDKRQDLKTKESEREIRKAMTRRMI